jgi:exodeoxyribonuclease-5
VRKKGAEHISLDVVVVDECSMLDSELMTHIDRHLGHVFVLYVGDPAQLPPVNEKESLSFQTASKSHLSSIVRQAADNPVIKAAHVIRSSQGGPLDMSWVKRENAKPMGVYIPNGGTDDWMKKAFTSDEFQKDNDTFRYLCWTNERVAQINTKVRRWIYGETVEPFAIGENALIRAPIFSPINPRRPTEDRKILFNTNEEAPVLAIQRGHIGHRFEATETLDSWEADIPAWQVTLLHSDGSKVPVTIPQDYADFDAVNSRLVSEAKTEPKRWGHRHDFAQDVARLQSVYALTTHNSQGSTFRNVFVDVGDIKRRARTNVLETQQMLYVAATRASHALMLVNV